MRDNEARRLNRYKRPHYAPGDKVRVLGCGALDGETVEVQRSDAWQSISGTVITYLYEVKRANGGVIMIAEADLAPRVSASDTRG